MEQVRRHTKMTEKEFMKKYLESFKLDGRLKNIGEAKKRVKVFF